MEYMPSVASQTLGLVYSAGLGFCLGLLFDLFKIFFYLLTGSDKKLSLVRDIIYMLFFMSAEFLFLLVIYSGRLMLYAFFGEAVGLLAYFYSLSGIVITLGKRACTGLRRLFGAVFTFFYFIGRKLSLLLQKVRKFSKKFQKIFKKTLANST